MNRERYLRQIDRVIQQGPYKAQWESIASCPLPPPLVFRAFRAEIRNTFWAAPHNCVCALRRIFSANPAV